ncbi:MAG TPA: hypothetical protein P5549_02400 [Syntrophomonas sp.]|jgi:hypothetical protein|nr:hypothetical protein [Syntrophomonas sp.]
MRQVLLKYCGGCNPTINRSKIIAEVKRGLPPDVELVSKTADQVAEVGIMMSGCSTTCLDREDVRKQAQQWIVVGGNNVNYFPVENDQLADQIIKKIIDCLPPASK